MQVDRNEMDRRADIASGELFNKGIAPNPQHAGSQAQHEQVPRVLDVGPFDGKFQGLLALKCLDILSHDVASPRLERDQLAELPHAERGLDIRQVVLESRVDDRVAPAAALVVETPGAAAHAVEADAPGERAQG